MKFFKVLFVAGLFFIANAGMLWAQNAAPDQKLGEVLKGVILENFDAYEKEDLTRVLNTVHTQSYGYLTTKQATQEIFTEYDLHYELLGSSFVGQNGDFALMRVQQKTTKVSGPAFRDNELDIIFIFKQENSRWKFWTQAVLDIKFLN